MDVNYTDVDRERIEAGVVQILKDNPRMSRTEAQVREVINRYRGDNGLSRHGADYLSSCIMVVINESKNEGAWAAPHDGYPVMDDGTH